MIEIGRIIEAGPAVSRAFRGAELELSDLPPTLSAVPTLRRRSRRFGFYRRRMQRELQYFFDAARLLAEEGELDHLEQTR